MCTRITECDGNDVNKLMNMKQELWHGRWKLAEGFRDAEFPCRLLIAPNSLYWTCTSAFRSALFSCHSFIVLRPASSPGYLPNCSEMGMAQPSWDQAVWKGPSLREHYVLVLCCETFWRSTLGGNVIVCTYKKLANDGCRWPWKFPSALEWLFRGLTRSHLGK